MFIHRSYTRGTKGSRSLAELAKFGEYGYTYKKTGQNKNIADRGQVATHSSCRISPFSPTTLTFRGAFLLDLF